MPRLTDEERAFRKNGAGIPFSRWWALPVVVVACSAAAFNPLIWLQCLGASEVPEMRGKAGIVGMVVAVPCSPYLLKGEFWDWLTFFGMWLPVPFAIINWRWSKRLRAYWDKVRLRERESRKRRRAENAIKADKSNSDGKQTDKP